MHHAHVQYIFDLLRALYAQVMLVLHGEGVKELRNVLESDQLSTGNEHTMKFGYW